MKKNLLIKDSTTQDGNLEKNLPFVTTNFLLLRLFINANLYNPRFQKTLKLNAFPGDLKSKKLAS
ncbi:MAG: hypothetical protein MUF15_08200 [Acidobacteria bacterium]|jgi:hypothetical protein|nr:hypothetical protein [Acidobacteriota bacterium]